MHFLHQGREGREGLAVRVVFDATDRDGVLVAANLRFGADGK
jgi:hypothetical protein